MWYLYNYLCCVAESIPDFRKFCFDQALLWPKSSVYSLTCLIRTVFHWLASGSAHLTSRVFSGAHPLPVLSATGHRPVTIKPLLGTRTNAQWVSKWRGDVSRNHSYTSAGGNWFIPWCSIWEPHTYLSVTQLDVSSAQLLLGWMAKIPLAISAMRKWEGNGDFFF